MHEVYEQKKEEKYEEEKRNESNISKINKVRIPSKEQGKDSRRRPKKAFQRRRDIVQKYK